MDLTATLPTSVYLIWALVLALVVAVIVPLAIALLHRTLRAALSIRRYLDEMLQAGAGIAGNTGSIGALNDTIGVAGAMVGTATSIKQHSGTIATVLSERAARGRAS
jgi:hypothetical protein